MAKMQSGESIEDWIKRAPENLIPVLHRLRNDIQNLPITLEERVKWSQPCYGIDKKNAFNLDWHASYATLQLWVGAHLPDPAEIVEGTGKDLRHVKINSIGFENWNEVEQLMVENLRHLGWLE
ncbi:MAG: DUF1801 domain-containing protein [Candidatus Thermoplasmatota archaeon]|nr:DUF1801 domain-containing protein [Candidatus Thermoplasmatota archaeon]